MADPFFSDLAFEAFLNQEKLMGCRCRQCGVLFVPPRPICTACHSEDLEWEAVPEKGRLRAFTCIAIGPAFMLAEGFSRDNPYCCGVVELAEGTRVDARIEGVDPKNPEAIRIGMLLKAKYRHRESADRRKTYLAFEPT